MVRHRLRPALLLVTCSTLLALPFSSSAEGGREIQVAGRTLSFIDGGPSGRVVFAIVYNSSNAASVAEKDDVMAALGGGLVAGGATVVGKPVDMASLATAGDVGAYYLTHGVNYAVAGAAAKGRKILSISSDMACVQSGACVMGVAATPKVEIVVNSAAAAASGVRFKAAFKMMIKEI